jgi:hypothetical protein
MKYLITEEEDKKSLTDEEKKLLKFLMDKGLINSASKEKIQQLLGSAETENAAPDKEVIENLKNFMKTVNPDNFQEKAYYPVDPSNYSTLFSYYLEGDDKKSEQLVNILKKNNILTLDLKNDQGENVIAIDYKLLSDYIKNNDIKQSTNENKLAKRLKLLANIEK